MATVAIKPTRSRSGGTEQVRPPSLYDESYMDLNDYDVFTNAGSQLVQNPTELEAASPPERPLGIFSISNMTKLVGITRYEERGTCGKH